MRKLPRLIMLVLAAMAAASQVPAGAEPLPPGESSQFESRLDDPEVQYMARRGGLTLQDAAERIRWQAAAQQLRSGLARDFPNSFLDLTVSPGDGHKLKLRLHQPSVADAAAMRKRLAAMNVEHVTDVTSASTSLAALQTLSATVTNELRVANEGASDDLTTYVDTSAEAVVVVDPAEGSRTERQRAYLANETARRRVQVKRDETHFESLDRCNDTGWLHCDPPLRGGVHVRVDNVANCSAGFNTRTKDSNAWGGYWISVLTAGHCFGSNWPTGENVTGFFASGGAHGIGPEVSGTVDSRGDAGTFRVRDPAGWLPSPEVVVFDRQETSRDNHYYIASYGQAATRDTICLTGGISRTTRCGMVTNDNYPVKNSSGATNYVVRTSICDMIKGDSGGPSFSGHLAIGILQGKFSSGPCDVGIMDIRRALLMSEAELRTTNGWQGTGW